MHSPTLAPIVALVAWSLIMQTWLYATRIPAMRVAPTPLDPPDDRRTRLHPIHLRKLAANSTWVDQRNWPTGVIRSSL